ncbi:MAG: response regulator transcription factor [Verrucomicrobia bacterium]|nr:response regulator transcription factor [Verrucomicrobiota bacterium]
MSTKASKPASAPRRVAIVEDDSGLRQQLERILKNAERTTCVGSYCSAEEALEDIFEAKPDVVLMDINLPGMSGIECVARLRNGLPDAHVIMLTIYEDSDRIFKALQAGADGYLVKSSPTKTLLEAIEDVYVGGSPMSSSIARKVVRQFRSSGSESSEAAKFSPRERQVLDLLSSGSVYKEIADQLGIGTETVRTYAKSICKKLHARTRTEAVAKFLRQWQRAERHRFPFLGEWAFPLAASRLLTNSR